MYQSRTRQLKLTLYGLKRRYGVPIDLYVPTYGNTNLMTGVKDVTLTIYNLPRVTILPTYNQHKFEYDLTYIAANKNFTYGGLFSIGLKQFLLDREDLPNDFELSKNDYFVYAGRRYNVEAYLELDHKLGYHVYGREVQREKPYQTISVSFTHRLQLQQGIAQND